MLGDEGALVDAGETLQVLSVEGVEDWLGEGLSCQDVTGAVKDAARRRDNDERLNDTPGVDYVILNLRG